MSNRGSVKAISEYLNGVLTGIERDGRGVSTRERSLPGKQQIGASRGIRHSTGCHQADAPTSPRSYFPRSLSLCDVSSRVREFHR